MCRKSLSFILCNVGPKFLKYIIGEISSKTLWGRFKHVLGYTLYYLLNELDLNNLLNNNDIDYCINNIVNIMLYDINGPVGAEKLLRKRRNRGIEMSNSKASIVFKTLAKYVKFNPNIYLLLLPINKFVQNKNNLQMNDWRIKNINTILYKNHFHFFFFESCKCTTSIKM